MAQQLTIEQIGELITAIPDFPQKGILFRDIFPIFLNPNAVKTLVNEFVGAIQEKQPNATLIAGLDARGFLLGPMVAYELNIGFIPIRKKGKLPGETVVQAYEKEYGTDYFELQKNSVKAGDVVVVLDDLLATGGSAEAAHSLINKAGARVAGSVFIVELVDLKGRDRLSGDFVHSLFKY